MSDPFAESPQFEVRRQGDRFAIYHPLSQVRITVDDVERGKRETVAHWTWWDAMDAREPRRLMITKTNLLALRTLKELAEALASVAGNLTQDWPGLVHGVAQLLLAEMKAGVAPIRLGDQEPDYDKPRWLYHPYLQADGVSIVFGEGGTLKSYLAMWVAIRLALGMSDTESVARDPLPTLYLDWEVHEEQRQRIRFWALMRGLCGDMAAEQAQEAPFFWRDLYGSLGDSLQWIQDFIVKEGIGAVVIDSLGMASSALGSITDDASTTKHHSWAQQLGVPVLEIHHERKPNGNTGPERHNMYGSVYTFNQARLVTSVSTTEEQRYEGGAVHKVAVACEKLSDGQMPTRHAVTWTFQNTPRGDARIIEVSRGALTDEPELAEKWSNWDRARIAIEKSRDGALTAKELCDAIELSAGRVKNLCSGWVSQGMLTVIGTAAHGERRYALCARVTESRIQDHA